MKKRYTDQFGDPLHYVDASLDDLGRWDATVPQIREAVFAFHVTAMRMVEGMIPREALIFMPSQREVESAAEMAYEAFQAGRVIDFGHLPNDVMKQGGARGGPLYTRGALGLPFLAPWVLFHTWEGGACCYLINPLGSEPTQGELEICELHPVRWKDSNILLIADRLMMDPADEDEENHPGQYASRVAPCVLRFLPGPEVARMNNHGDPANAASGNCLDPLMTALLILNTRNVGRETVRPDGKLNKARAKSGKLPIPPFVRVDTGPYVTAIQARKTSRRGEALGGTHAPPKYHIRLGHPREFRAERYKEKRGTTTFIADTLVNATEEARKAFKGSRSHYEVKR